MPLVLSLAGFLGAWLLVAGPVYQAFVELENESVDQNAVHDVLKSVPAPAMPSPWWWLLPPVAFVKRQRVNREFREQVTRSLPGGVLEQWVHFNQKATGWLMVGAGGSLLALKETWELVEALDWQPWAFWPLAVGAFLACVTNTAVQSRRAHQALGTASRAAEAAGS